jgi:hypothetical protein
MNKSIFLIVTSKSNKLIATSFDFNKWLRFASMECDANEPYEYRAQVLAALPTAKLKFCYATNLLSNQINWTWNFYGKNNIILNKNLFEALYSDLINNNNNDNIYNDYELFYKQEINEIDDDSDEKEENKSINSNTRCKFNATSMSLFASLSNLDGEHLDNDEHTLNYLNKNKLAMLLHKCYLLSGCMDLIGHSIAIAKSACDTATTNHDSLS